MLTTSSAFATHGDAHGVHPVMVAIDGCTVNGTPFNSFLNGFHPIGSKSHLFGWPYASLGWKAIPFKDNHPPNLDFMGRTYSRHQICKCLDVWD